MAATGFLCAFLAIAAAIIGAFLFSSAPVDDSKHETNCLRRCEKQDGRYCQQFVCVCNLDYCDRLITELGDINTSTIIIYTTSKDGKRLERKEHIFDRIQIKNGDRTNGEIVFKLDFNTKYQEIVGFGGGFSDAFGINMEFLSKEMKEKLLNSYFGSEGIGYTMGRVPIGTSNFGSHSYTHNDLSKNDWEMQNYSLTEYDFLYKIKFLKEAMELNSGVLKLVATPWIAPQWLVQERGTLSSILLGKPGGQHYKAWANYICKFLEMYTKLGLDIWGITTLNNPYTSVFPMFNLQLMSMNPAEDTSFIREDLSPALLRAGFDKVKIFIGDDQFTYLPDVVKILAKDLEKSEYVNGVAAQWYYDWLRSPEFLDEIHNKYEDKMLITTDSSFPLVFIPENVKLGSWENAGFTAKRIIKGLNHWMNVWLEGHLALDVSGGPHWAGFASDAPIIINTTSNEFYKQPAYYVIAHFSKFIIPGSKRIKVDVIKDGEKEDLFTVAFLTPDGNIVFVIYNSGDKVKTYSIKMEELDMTGRIESCTVQTLIWKLS